MLADIFHPAPGAEFDIPLIRVPSNPALPPASYAPLADLDDALDGPWIEEPFLARVSPVVVAIPQTDVYQFQWPGMPFDFDPTEVVPLLAITSIGPFPGPPSPPPSPPIPPHAGHNKPFVERDVTADQRLRRHTEKVSMILNSLMGRGQLVQTDPQGWEIVVPESPPSPPPPPPGPVITYTNGSFTV